MKCSECGVEIYASAEEESVGGKHALFFDDQLGPMVVRFICLPCSNKYEEVTPRMEKDKTDD